MRREKGEGADELVLSGKSRKRSLELVLDRGRRRDGCLERLDLERMAAHDWEAYAKAQRRTRPAGLEPEDGR